MDQVAAYYYIGRKSGQLIYDAVPDRFETFEAARAAMSSYFLDGTLTPKAGYEVMSSSPGAIHHFEREGK